MMMMWLLLLQLHRCQLFIEAARRVQAKCFAEEELQGNDESH